MVEIIVPEFGKDFLKSIDDFLKKHWMNLTCQDIYNIYFDFFFEQKQWKGTAAGFTGLSEYIIFRFLIHQLGGDFEGVNVPDDKRHLETANWVFRSQSNPRLVISNNIRLPEFGYDRPDIVIWLDDDIVAIIQIKIYMSSGVAEVSKEFDNFLKYHGEHKRMRALLLTYSNLSSSKRSKIRPELDRLSKENEWFDYLILDDKMFQDEKRLLAYEIDKHLNTERL